MAYNHYQLEVQLATSVLSSGTGDKRKWGPGVHPHIVRGFSILTTVTKVKVTKPVYALRLATNGTASVTGNEKATLTLPSGNTKGIAYYRSVTPFTVKPDEEAVLTVKTACTVAYAVKAVLYIEPSWNTPAALGTGVIKTVTA